MEKAFVYGDVVRCISALSTTTGPLKANALYVVEAVAKHGKSVKIAGDWHSINRFEKVGHSSLSADPDRAAFDRMCVKFEHLEAARRGVLCGFEWDQSDEGDAYWSEVHAKLDDYCDRFRPYAGVNDADKAA